MYHVIILSICSQDFESDPELKSQVVDLLEEMVVNTNLLPAEHKAAASILRTISKDPSPEKCVDLVQLLTPPKVRIEMCTHFPH